MVNKKEKSGHITEKRVLELIDTHKDPPASRVLILILRGFLVIAMWSSLKYMYVNGYSDALLAGIGFGASSILILIIVVTTIKQAIPSIIKKYSKILNTEINNN